MTPCLALEVSTASFSLSDFWSPYDGSLPASLLLEHLLMRGGYDVQPEESERGVAM